MPRRFVSVYLSIAVPFASAPKLAFVMRADCAPADWASRPAARPASTAHSAARWIRLDLPMSRMTLPPRGTGVGDSRPPGDKVAPGHDRRAGLEDLEAGAVVERVGRARDRLDGDPRASARGGADRISGVDGDEAEALVQRQLDRAIRAREADPRASFTVAREVAEARVDLPPADAPRAREVICRPRDRDRRPGRQHPLVDGDAGRRGDLERPVIGAPAQVRVQPAAERRRRVAGVRGAQGEAEALRPELVDRLDAHRERVARARAQIARERDRARGARDDLEA